MSASLAGCWPPVQRLSTSLPSLFDAVIVGAGPAGVALVSTLLSSPTSTPRSYLWIDPHFTSGRLSQYTEVPSNTTVALFQQFALATPVTGELCQKLISHPLLDPLSSLRTLNQDTGCDLVHAARMVTKLSRALLYQYSKEYRSQVLIPVPNISLDSSNPLVPFLGKVNKIEKLENSWQVTLDEDAFKVKTKSIYFAQGSFPRPSVPIPIEMSNLTSIPLDVVLTPSLLRAYFHKTSNASVAVIGSSHSAILAALHLLHLDAPPHQQAPALPPSSGRLQVRLLWRDRLLFAERRKDGSLKYDNTGLKGMAAEWTKRVVKETRINNEITYQVVDSLKNRFELIRPMDNVATWKEALKGVTHVVYAVGYQRSQLPSIQMSNTLLDDAQIQHDPHSGQLLYRGQILPHLYGFGIAWPEETIDQDNIKEGAVGLWKFMRYIRQVVPNYISKL